MPGPGTSGRWSTFCITAMRVANPSHFLRGEEYTRSCDRRRDGSFCALHAELLRKLCVEGVDLFYADIPYAQIEPSGVTPVHKLNVADTSCPPSARFTSNCGFLSERQIR